MEPPVSLLHTIGDRSSTWRQKNAALLQTPADGESTWAFRYSDVVHSDECAILCGLYRVHQVAMMVERECRPDGNKTEHHSEGAASLSTANRAEVCSGMSSNASHADPEGRIADPALDVPLPTEAMIHTAKADDAVAAP